MWGKTSSGVTNKRDKKGGDSDDKQYSSQWSKSLLNSPTVSVIIFISLLYLPVLLIVFSLPSVLSLLLLANSCGHYFNHYDILQCFLLYFPVFRLLVFFDSLTYIIICVFIMSFCIA